MPSSAKIKINKDKKIKSINKDAKLCQKKMHYHFSNEGDQRGIIGYPASNPLILQLNCSEMSTWFSHFQTLQLSWASQITWNPKMAKLCSFVPSFQLGWTSPRPWKLSKISIRDDSERFSLQLLWHQDIGFALRVSLFIPFSNFQPECHGVWTDESPPVECWFLLCENLTEPCWEQCCTNHGKSPFIPHTE